ncbi:uncharacterized protein DUF3168 [Haloactinopolyspora alba]|uniref:Uncharacterized protein DUF3168 n=1 Tax=Haloactinopolyspora alba TaxID=648780 RepID=A0A2P8DHL6_9ACTN|nr:DUF3168 domain-containing protein [Haloactinopolyspora alba]PSK96698.1 uncharacterized protein DUF3168 [Haloactinopolyspora alba]
MLAEHIAAVSALIPTDVAALYDGQVPTEPAYPYNVIWSTGGTRPSTSLTEEMSQLEVSLYVTTVAATAESVRIIQGSVRDALLGVRPVVSGRSCWRLSILYSEPIRQDADVTIPATTLHPMYGVDVWRLASIPA